MATLTADDVRALFNRKAGSWHAKYVRSGDLDSRLERFSARLAELSPPPARILDLGCGTGDMAAAFSRLGYHVTACDIAGEMIGIARATHSASAVEWICLPPEWRVLPFTDSSFDGIVASSVFEYLTDVPAVARELSRVLRPEGILLLTVPNPFSHVRKIEGQFRKIVSNRHLLTLLKKVRYVDSYAMYLLLSRNRLSGEEWNSVLSSAHFAALDERDFSEDTWGRQAKTPLILLTVKRVSTS